MRSNILRRFPEMVPEIFSLGKYKLTPFQEDILTIISFKVYEYNVTNKPFTYNNMGYISIELSCKDLGIPYKNGKKMKQLQDLVYKNYTYRYLDDGMEKWVSVPFISGMEDIKGTDKIEVCIHPLIIDFLDNYGKSESDTIFSCVIALSLSGYYTKRFYKHMCSLANSYQYYDYSIERFKEDFMIPSSYTNAQIRKRILRPVENQIRRSNSFVWLSFRMVCLNPVKGKKPKADTIRFCINELYQGKEDTPYYKYIYLVRFFTNIYQNHPDKILGYKVTKKISDIGKFEEAFEKCFKENEDILSGSQTREKAEEKIKHMIENEYGLSFRKLKKRLYIVELKQNNQSSSTNAIF